jgi:thiol-disulfide isomerase/thioredoxin
VSNVSGQVYNKGIRKEMRNKMIDKSKFVCVYDGTETWAYFCPSCKEYKGLMPIMEAIATYDFIAEMYEEDELAFMPS